MYLVFTLISAIAATVLWAKNKGCRLEVLCFIYWGASLMWLVDSIVSVMEGGPFFEMTADAALLGAVVVSAGLAVWGIVLLTERKRKNKQKDQQKTA